jgi:ferritin
MLGEKIEKALNAQVNAELYSAYLYQAMHAWLLSKSFVGFAAWMQAQALEEISHGMKIYGFIDERGGRIQLDLIDKPPFEWDSPLSVFAAVCEHEAKVTGLINDLVDLAIMEKDHATNIFLQWFVSEQVEEEATANQIFQKVKFAGKEGNSLFLIDKELAARVFILPPGVAIQPAP